MCKLESMKRLLSIILAGGLLTSCYKDVPPADIVGSWQAVHEDWTITTNGKKTTANTMTLNYSDRFTPLEEGSTKHTKVTFSVKMKRGKIKSGRTYWGVVSSTEDSMVMEYDSGSLDIDGTDIRRKCRFVFEKTWDKVVGK